MAFDYYGTAADTLAALLEYGAADPGVTLTRTTPGAYDPATSSTAPPVVLTTAGVGLVFDYGLHASGASTHDGTLIQAGDKQCYLAALDAAGVAIAAPVKGDKALAPDGVTYGVENVKTLAPAGVPVLYELQLRR